MKTPLYNQAGEKVGEAELSERIFGATGDLRIVHQVAVALESQLRPVLAHVKTRGEVRGGGRKPWKQKGTGRARHGSIRSPLWIGGGTTFGPRNTRNWTKRINKKMKRKALELVLTDKAANEKIMVVDKIELPEIKTSVVAKMLKALKLNNTTAVLATGDAPGNMIKSSRNVPGVYATKSDQLSVLDLLKHEYLVLTRDALDTLTKQLES